jgi:hypothetical protein
LFRFNIETGSFGVSKQPKQTKDKPKQQQTCYNIHLFNSLYHKFCFFRLFRYRSETSKQTETNQKKKFWVSRKSKPKNSRNRLSFGLFRFEPRKKINGFEYPLIDNFLGEFFWFVSRKFCLFRLFRYWSETPKQTKTNQKKCFLVLRNKPKKNRNRLSFGLFRFEPKKIFDCFEDTLRATSYRLNENKQIHLKG